MFASTAPLTSASTFAARAAGEGEADDAVEDDCVEATSRMVVIGKTGEEAGADADAAKEWVSASCGALDEAALAAATDTVE